jgi:hypothetical protein
MKFHSGQKVTVLDTYFKPAGSAVIIQYQEFTDKYEVGFKYPGNDTIDQIYVPEERLVILQDNTENGSNNLMHVA